MSRARSKQSRAAMTRARAGITPAAASPAGRAVIAGARHAVHNCVLAIYVTSHRRRGRQSQGLIQIVTTASARCFGEQPSA